ncbi:MAG TPA: MFS transporter [Myxococcaceae bacterium]|nr:MFS transporter [Myxococcaceae bacterium]
MSASNQLTARRVTLLPSGATRDASTLLTARSLRAFADGFVSVLLPAYLIRLGFSGFQVGAIATATLAGSAALTLLVGMVAHRFSRRRLLVQATILMALTGVGFAFVHQFWPLMVIAFVGTLNPSAGDVSVILPLEQSLLPQTVPDQQRTSLFARYSFVASLAGAAGALSSAIPALVAAHRPSIELGAMEAMFLLYGALGIVACFLYRTLSSAVELPGNEASSALGKSRRRVYALAALFSIDAFGGGFIVQSLLALWLFNRFHLSLEATGSIFFWTGILSGLSYLAAASIARRYGLIRTMVFTHLPSNILLVLVPLMPSLPLALGLLLARSALSQMDVPTRTSYVMAVVSPAERPAAASVTAVPRSLAASASPLLAGYLLGLTTFGWPLLLAGVLKGAYDILLLTMFAQVRPPEEAAKG